MVNAARSPVTIAFECSYPLQTAPAADPTTINKNAGGSFSISETSKADGFTGFDTDKLNVLIVDPNTGETATLFAVGERKQKNFTISAPSNLNTENAEFFLFYTSADGKKASDSVNLTATVQP